MKWKQNFWKNELKEIAHKTQNELKRVFWDDSHQLIISQKSDRSLVTEIDHYVSNLIKEKIGEDALKSVCFFSEEDNVELFFPAIILDPIDGTSQLAKGQSDCCISLALVEDTDVSSDKNLAWIYNPFTGFEINTSTRFVPPKNINTAPFLGLISKSDYKRGIFNDLNVPEDVILFPKGSIALKLALLADGFCDFVFSRTPKNIWDVAAGCILLQQRGYRTYTREGELKKIDKDIFQGPLLWCREEHFETLKGLLEY